MLCLWRGFLFSCSIFIMYKLMFWSLFVTLQTKHSQRMNVWPDLPCLRSSVSPDSPGVPPARWAFAAQRGAPAELLQLRDAPPAGMPERQTVQIKGFNHNPSKQVKHSSITLNPEMLESLPSNWCWHYRCFPCPPFFPAAPSSHFQLIQRTVFPQRGCGQEKWGDFLYVSRQMAWHTPETQRSI